MGVKEDAAAIAKRFAAIPAEVKAAIQPAVDQGADEMVSRIRHLAPDESGDLAASVRKEAGPRELSVRVAAGGELTTRETVRGPFDYALAQEYGTAEMHAQPFFWPSVNSLKKRVKRRIDRAIGKAIKSAWGN